MSDLAETRAPVDVAAERRRLIRLLQDAHAGERAAAFAYQGHAKSVRDVVERQDLARIEAEEWEHRRGIARMLAALGARPRRVREACMFVVGTCISWFCRVGGWFVPMYGAGRLERGNIVEYEIAAREAAHCGHGDFVDELLTMAEVEWDHERYFREKAASHGAWRWFPQWSPPPPRTDIRATFARDVPMVRPTHAALLTRPNDTNDTDDTVRRVAG